MTKIIAAFVVVCAMVTGCANTVPFGTEEIEPTCEPMSAYTGDYLLIQFDGVGEVREAIDCFALKDVDLTCYSGIGADWQRSDGSTVSARGDIGCAEVTDNQWAAVASAYGFEIEDCAVRAPSGVPAPR